MVVTFASMTINDKSKHPCRNVPQSSEQGITTHRHDSYFGLNSSEMTTRLLFKCLSSQEGIIQCPIGVGVVEKVLTNYCRCITRAVHHQHVCPVWLILSGELFLNQWDQSRWNDRPFSHNLPLQFRYHLLGNVTGNIRRFIVLLSNSQRHVQRQVIEAWWCLIFSVIRYSSSWSVIDLIDRQYRETK